MEAMGRIVKATRPKEYREAEEKFLSEIWMSPSVTPGIRIPGPRPCSGDVFERVRISANLALELGEEKESRERWVCATWVGVGRPRVVVKGAGDGDGVRGGKEDVVVLAPGVEVGGLPFVGESYEVAFLMPVLERGGEGIELLE